MPTYKNKIAIAYDFDGTLAPGNMQEYDFIPNLEMDIHEFWKEANEMPSNTIWMRYLPICF